MLLTSNFSAFYWPGKEGADVADDDTDESSSTRHHGKAGDTETNVRPGHIRTSDLAERLEHVVEDHCYTVIQQTFPEDDNIEDLVNFNLVKHSKDRYRVDSSNQGAKEESFQHSWICAAERRLENRPIYHGVKQRRLKLLTKFVSFSPEDASSSNKVEKSSDGEHVKDRPHHGHKENGAKLVEE